MRIIQQNKYKQFKINLIQTYPVIKRDKCIKTKNKLKTNTLGAERLNSVIKMVCELADLYEPEILLIHISKIKFEKNIFIQKFFKTAAKVLEPYRHEQPMNFKVCHVYLADKFCFHIIKDDMNKRLVDYLKISKRNIYHYRERIRNSQANAKFDRNLSDMILKIEETFKNEFINSVNEKIE